MTKPLPGLFGLGQRLHTPPTQKRRKARLGRGHLPVRTVMAILGRYAPNY